jgi:hypothetical protein
MSSGKTPAEQGIPREKIYEAMKSFDSAKLRVTRRNDRGQIAQLYGNVLIPTSLLLEIDSWLEPLCGGGTYIIVAENPNGTEPPLIVPPFTITLEAPLRPRVQLAPTQFDEANKPMVPTALGPGMGGQHSMLGGMPSMIPQTQPQQFGPTVPQYGPVPGGAWAQGLNSGDANSYIQAGNAMMGVQNPFQNPYLAAQQAAQYQQKKDSSVNNPVYDNVMAHQRGELAKAQAEATAAKEKLVELQQRSRDDYERLTREHERKVDEMRRQHELDVRRLEDTHREKLTAREEKYHAEERQWDRERQDLRDRTLRAEMGAQAAANAPKGNDLITQLTPVLVAALPAYMKSNAEKETADRMSQIELMKMQMAPKPDSTMELMKNILPLALPLLQQSISNKSPDAIAALLEATQNSQMQAIGMTMQMIEQMTPEEKPVWAQALMEFLGSMRGVGERIFDKFEQGQQQPQQQMRQLPQGQPQVMHQQSARPRETDPVAAEIDALLMPMLPPEFQTVEWRNIIVALKKAAPAEILSKMLADHLGMLIENKMLPRQLANFAEEPVDGLDSLIRPLVGPLGLTDDYAGPVMWQTLELLAERGLIDWEAPQGDGDGDEEDGETLDDAMEEAGIEHEEAMA